MIGKILFNNDFAEYVSASLLAEGVYKELFFPIILAQWSEEKQDIDYDYSKLNNEIERCFKNNELAKAKELVKIDVNLGKYNSAARERQVANMWEVISSVDTNNETMAKFFGELYNGFISTAGNDVFNGHNWHKDSYFFKAGHGQDVINDLGNADKSYLKERNDKW